MSMSVIYLLWKDEWPGGEPLPKLLSAHKSRTRAQDALIDAVEECFGHSMQPNEILSIRAAMHHEWCGTEIYITDQILQD